MTYLDRDGVRLHYREAGAGAPVLITHGYSATSHMWRDTLTSLAGAGWHGIAWDIRGHGGSDSPADVGAYSRDASLSDMTALLDHAGGGERAVLMGHSLGGYLSLSFTATWPERVRALILVGTGPGYRNPEARAGWNEQAEGRARYFEQRGLEGLESPSAHGGEHRSVDGLARAARGILAQHDSLVMDALPDIAVPVLVIVGENDTPFRGASDYMVKRIPGARQVVIEDAGHMPNLDRPAAFDAALQEFLEGL